MTSIPVLKSVSALVQNYDAWLCDIWGVLHNGETVYQEAVKACQNFVHSGGVVILITNAPRPFSAVKKQFETFYNIPEDAYHQIITSGDVTRSLIMAHAQLPMFHLGPERDFSVFEGLSVSFTSSEEAGLLVCTGLFDDDTETPEDYRDLFEVSIAKDVPMICANPDIKVERGQYLVYCAGALAQLYENLGGLVHYAGKPYAPIYHDALKALEILRVQKGKPVAKSRVLCIGDGLHTDMLGAERAGLDALYIASGLHMNMLRSGLSEKDVVALFQSHTVRPIAAQQALRW